MCLVQILAINPGRLPKKTKGDEEIGESDARGRSSVFRVSKSRLLRASSVMYKDFRAMFQDGIETSTGRQLASHRTIDGYQSPDAEQSSTMNSGSSIGVKKTAGGPGISENDASQLTKRPTTWHAGVKSPADTATTSGIRSNTIR